MTEPISEVQEKDGPPPSGVPVAEETATRTQKYRRAILDAPYEICIERARYYTEVYKQTEGQHPALRQAKALAHTLQNMTVYILDEEAIVGNRSGKLVASVIPVERGEFNVVLEMELERLRKRKFRPFKVTDEEVRELQEDILPYWRGKTLRDRKKELWFENNMYYPIKITPFSAYDRMKGFDRKNLVRMASYSGGNAKLLKKARVEIPMNNPGLVMNVFDTQGHLVLGHKWLIGEGFEGAKKRAEQKLAEVADDPEKKIFLEAVIMCCEAIRDFAGRYADLAEQKADTEKDPARQKELKEIAERCRRVPWQSPRDFREAVQWVWLAQATACISYGVGGIFALGRMDQYLWPYLKKDLDEGKITEDEALELIEELIIKFSYNLLVLPPYGKDTASELGADNMAVSIGGVGRDGEDAVNPMSYMFIKAAINMRSLTNSISFRISEKNPDEWVEAVMDLHRFTNGPSIFNDDAIIPALAHSGYPIEEARDYGIIGCVEPTSDGNTFGCTSGNDVSLTGALEMTLHQGKLRMMGRRIGPKTRAPKKFKSFDDVMDTFKEQVKWCIDFIAMGTKLKDQAYTEMLPCPYVSTLVKGCIDNAKDATHGGAEYNFNSISGRGLATVADSLAAIKKLVFEEKSLTMKELMKALDNNFKDNEELRQRLKTRPPKYGSDDDYADDIAREIAEFFCQEVMKHKPERGGIFRPSFFSYGLHVFEGQVLGATPDGRKSGEAVSNSISPTNQSEKKGPVAVMQSASKLNHKLIPNGCSLNIKFLPSMIESDAGLKKMAAMLRGYFKQGGQQVQFNAISDETLRAAQKDPEAFKDLVVRVSGYSAYFVDLGRPVQNDIIARMSFDSV